MQKIGIFLEEKSSLLSSAQEVLKKTELAKGFCC
jgi:hypothetical protein